MATTYTTNYNLGKQENHADKFDMDVITDNADKIDAALTAKADKSTTYTKTEVDTALSGKQATLTTAQLAAVNSGITSAGVEQIETNKNNILSIQDHYKYYNRTLFEQESIPTGTIAYGSTWIDGKAVRTYNQTTNIIGGVIEQGSWNAANIVKIDSTTRCRLSNSITVKPSTTYTVRLVSPTINNARVLLQYRDSNDYTSSESGWQTTLPYTFTTPSNCYKATIILSTVGDLICTPTDFGNLQINEGNTALSYEAPSWSTSSVDDVKKNENNILSLTANGGGKNKLNITATSSTEMTINDDKTISITVNATTTKQYNLTDWIPNDYVGMKISGMTVNSNVSTGYFISAQYSNNGSSWANETDLATIGSATILDYPYIRIAIVVREGNNLSNTLFKPMISADGGDYQPYAMSNVDLTEGVLKLQERFVNCQFIASRVDYTAHTFTVKRSTTLGRYHYGIFMVGTPATYGIYKIFYDDANTPASATVEKILGNSALTYTASITWNGLVGTLTLTGSDRAYGGIRGIWFD